MAGTGAGMGCPVARLHRDAAGESPPVTGSQGVLSFNLSLSKEVVVARHSPGRRQETLRGLDKARQSASRPLATCSPAGGAS